VFEQEVAELHVAELSGRTPPSDNPDARHDSTPP
jgi:hypothetical protein